MMIDRRSFVGAGLAAASPAKCAGCVWNLSSVLCSSMKRFLL
jgi:hypothetical protein